MSRTEFGLLVWCCHANVQWVEASREFVTATPGVNHASA